MTDKLYNGFREGRAPGDHKPNNQVRGMTQETITKEQILPTVSQMDAAIDTIITKMYGGLEAASIEHFLQTGKVNGSFRERLYDCIKTTFMLVDIKQKTEHLKQLSAERERAGKLVEAVQSFVQASDDFNIGYINRNGEITRCGIAALSVAFNAAEKRLRIALTESNKP